MLSRKGFVPLILLICRATAQLPAYLQNSVFTNDTAILQFPLLQNAGTPDLFAMPPCGTFLLEEATIDDMQNGMANGTLTSVQLCLCYLQRTLQTESYIK